MLKNIIIPEKIGNYFIFPQRILGFDISKAYVNAIQIYVAGNNNIVIEKYFEEHIPNDENLPHSEKVANAIKTILSKTDRYNYIKVALPSYLAIFKELTLPFIDKDKIKSILDFEIEPILPFSIDEAVADFIITKQDKKRKETTIFVAVARKKDIQELIEPFKNIGIQPSVVLVDIIGLYEIYKTLPTNLTDEGLILIDIEYNYTNISYLQNGQLKLVRSIQQGIYQITKNLAKSMNVDFDKATEYINQFGIKSNENPQYSESIEKVMNEFTSNIAFTLNSFKTLLPTFSEIKKINLIGRGIQIKNLNEFLGKYIKIPCENISINTILQNKNFKIKESLPNSAIISLGIAYPSSNAEDFNLLKKDLEFTDYSLLKKQILSTIFLVIFLFTMLIAFSYLQIKKLKNAVNSSTNQVTSVLKERFSITEPAVLKKLSEVVNEANRKVIQEENIWFAFSSQARFSFLKYLQELSSIIDRAAIGLELKSLSITQGLITLEGEVRDYKALETLENELNESKLFSHVTIPQETKFTIKLTIKKNEEI